MHLRLTPDTSMPPPRWVGVSPDAAAAETGPPRVGTEARSPTFQRRTAMPPLSSSRWIRLWGDVAPERPRPGTSLQLPPRSLPTPAPPACRKKRRRRCAWIRFMHTGVRRWGASSDLLARGRTVTL